MNRRRLLPKRRWLSVCVAVAAIGLVGSGCAKKSGGDDQQCEGGYQGDCEVTYETGLLLKDFGSYTYEIPVGTPQTLTAMVMRVVQGGDCDTGGIAEGVPVNFEIITPNADASLNASSVTTSASGISQAEFTANEEGTFQVQASAEGTCPVTFTVRVGELGRALRVVGGDVFNAWTHVRVTLTVKAFSPMPPPFGEMPLTGENITFTLGAGGTGTSLQDTSNTQNGAEVNVATGPTGIAVVQMNTGSLAVTNGVDVTATLAGTQPVTFRITIQESISGGACQTNADCPQDYPLCDNGTCVENPNNGGVCQTNADCIPPYVCVDVGGQLMCVQPNTQGTPCDPIEASPCPPGEVCIAGFCTPNPTDQPCITNTDCPNGWICVDGVCVPDPINPECVLNSDCGGNMVCIGGQCVDPGDCQPPPDPARLAGTWNFDSTLHLRDALAGWISGFLGAMEILRDIIQGNLDLGLPSWLESIIESAIQGIINAYVPPWGQDLIVALGDISDILDDMRVLHTVNMLSQGNYEYVGTSTWDLLEFEFRGQVISERPENIPQIGFVPIYNFTSREICHVYFIDDHDIHNVVGGLISWVVDVLVTAITCSYGQCMYSLEDALDYLIDCDAIAYAIDDFVYNSFGIEVYDAVYNGCNAAKGPAIQSIVQYIDDLTVTFNLLTMRGQGNIIDNWHLGQMPADPGRWYGSLAGGSFDGEWTAVKQ